MTQRWAGGRIKVGGFGMYCLENEYTVLVNNWPWTIRFVSPDTRELEDNMGVTLWETHEILINNKLPPDPSRATIMHEITHAILGSCGLAEAKKDEQVCDLIGYAIPKCLETMDLKLLCFVLGRGLRPYVKKKAGKK